MKMAAIITLAILIVIFIEVKTSIVGVYQPNPGAMILFGSGMIGVAVWGRRKARM